jgi:uroporphyrin-III C-methyltransferase
MDRGEFDRKLGASEVFAGDAWSARSPRVGFVSLVGVGPGDPELLTLKAARALAEAEVVAYDELVSEEILALAPSEAERIPVGRRGGGVRHHEVDLHPSVVERARMGKRVVRLKGGDPSIFGRVGEEALVLAEAGVPFEIVPGVSAALGAAASLALPLTHRLVSSAVTFVTAHLAPRADGTPDLERFERQIADLPREGTIVFYMGLGALSHLRAALAKAGWSLETPALAVSKATTAAERAVSGKLEDLPALVEAARLEAPALVIVGQVVAVRERVEALRAASPVAAPPLRERGSAAKLFARLRRRLVKVAA